eukprot:3630872-Rhodomonas_salina.2
MRMTPVCGHCDTTRLRAQGAAEEAETNRACVHCAWRQQTWLGIQNAPRKKTVAPPASVRSEPTFSVLVIVNSRRGILVSVQRL